MIRNPSITPVSTLLATKFVSSETVWQEVDQLRTENRHLADQNEALQHKNTQLQAEITRLLKEVASLGKASVTDSLTGLFNRGYFNRALTRTLESSNQNNVPFSLLLFDIDFFKGVNDSFGHLAGDQILIGIGKLLQRSVRTYDTIVNMTKPKTDAIIPPTVTPARVGGRGVCAYPSIYRTRERCPCCPSLGQWHPKRTFFRKRATYPHHSQHRGHHLLSCRDFGFEDLNGYHLPSS